VYYIYTCIFKKTFLKTKEKIVTDRACNTGLHIQISMYMIKICEKILTDMLACNTGLNIQISMYMIKICEQSLTDTACNTELYIQISMYMIKICEQSLTDTACNTGLHIQISMYMIKICEQSLTINIIFTESWLNGVFIQIICYLFSLHKIN